MDERHALQAMLHSELASDDEPSSPPSSSDSDDHLDVGGRRSQLQLREQLSDRDQRWERERINDLRNRSRPWDQDRERGREREYSREMERKRAEEQAAQAAQQLLHARAVAQANPNNPYPPRFDRHVEQANSYQQRAVAVAVMQAAGGAAMQAAHGGAAPASARHDAQPMPAGSQQLQLQQQQQAVQMHQESQRRMQELQAQQARIQQAQQAQQQMHQLQQQLQAQQQQLQQQQMQHEESLYAAHAPHSPVHSKHPSSSSGSGSSSSGTAIDDLLRCFICYGRVVAPHLCPSCSKIGCKACYTTWISERGKSECPFCRSHLTLDRLVNCRWMTELTTALGEMGVMDSSQRDKAKSANASASCATHPSQSLSYFCLTCSTPLCSDCALFDSSSGGKGGGHKGHEFAKLDAIYAEHVELVSTEKAKLAVRLAALVSRNDSVSRNMSVLTRKKDEASHDLGIKVAEMEAALSRQLKTKLAALQAQKLEIGRESQMLSALLSELAQQLDPSVLPKHRLIEKTAGILDALYEMQAKPSIINGPGAAGAGAAAGAAAGAVGAASPSAASAASAEGLEGHEQALAASVAASVLGAESPPNVDGLDALGGAAGSAGSLLGSSASALQFQSELVPAWTCSPLVRVGSFHEKRRLAANEEEQIKLKAQQMQMAQQAQQQMANGGGGGAEGELPLLPSLPAPQHEVLYSAPLWSNGQCWRLKLYPCGNGQARPSYISLFVELTFSHLKNPHGTGLPIAGADSEFAAAHEGEEDSEAESEAAAAVAAESEAEEGKHDDSRSLPPLPGLKLPPQPPHAFNLFPPRSSAAGGSKSAELLSGHQLQNKYEYRVELLPHPSHFPDIGDHISLAILARADAADSPLRSQTVASYLEGLQYVHAHDSKLCAALAAFQSKIVSRVFSSNFEHGEAWGYNRFYRIDLLGDEGYLGSPDDASAAAAAASSASAAEAASPGGVAAASAASSSAAAPASKVADDDELLFRYYIRPPSTYLLSLESRAWIAHLEQHAHRQARLIKKMQRQARNTKQRDGFDAASAGAASAAAAAAAASPVSAAFAADSQSRSSLSAPRSTSLKVSAPITLRSAALKPAAADAFSAAAAAPCSSPSAVLSAHLPPSSSAVPLSRAESEERDREAALQLHAQLNDSRDPRDHDDDDDEAAAAAAADGQEDDDHDPEDHEPLDRAHHSLHAELQLDDMQSSDSEASDAEEEGGAGDDELRAAIASADSPSDVAAAAAPSSRRA